MPKVQIDYSKLSLGQPKSVHEYVVKDFNKQLDGIEVASVSYMKGERMENFKARISCCDNSSIEIPVPEAEDDKAKLAAVVYLWGKMRHLDTKVLFVSKNWDISTKHPGAHASKLQKHLDMLAEGREVPDYIKDEPKNRGVKCRQMTEDQYHEYKRMHESRRRIFDTLCTYSESNGRIREDSLNNYLREVGMEKEDVLRLNDDFAKAGLDFEIEYGRVSYIEHMEEVGQLKSTVRGLSRKVGELEKELEKSKKT